MLEADDYDPVAKTGWDVVLIGRSEILSNGDDIGRLDQTLQTWAHGHLPHFIRITPENRTRTPDQPALTWAVPVGRQPPDR